MCIKQCIIFSYLLPCKLYINGDNNPQVLIYMTVIMPFYKPDRTYTTKSTSRGYMDAGSFYDSCVLSVVRILNIGVRILFAAIV